MYRIELAPGEETVFRTIEELAIGVRNGLVTSRSRIYHSATQKWLPIEFHPHYKKALELSAHRQDLPATPIPQRLDQLSFAVARVPAPRPAAPGEAEPVSPPPAQQVTAHAIPTPVAPPAPAAGTAAPKLSFIDTGDVASDAFPEVRSRPNGHAATSREAAKPEATRPEATRVEATRPEPTRHEASRPEPSRPEPSRPEPTRHEAARHDARAHATRTEAALPHATRSHTIAPVLVKPVAAGREFEAPVEAPTVVRTRVEFPALAALAEGESGERASVPPAVASPVLQFPAIVYPEITPAEQPVAEPVSESARNRRPLHVAGAIVVLALGGYGMLSFAPLRGLASAPQVADRPPLSPQEPMSPPAASVANVPPPPAPATVEPKAVVMNQPASSGFAPALEARAIVASSAPAAAALSAAPAKDSTLAPAPAEVVLEVPVIAGAESLMATPRERSDSAMKRILRAVNGGKDLPPR
jgi:hypothetical protein